MPNENCCVTPAEMRVIYFESTSNPVQTLHKVTKDKVFVLTAWTMVNETGQRATVWLLRGKERVALNRIVDPAAGFNHVTFPTGIAFSSEAELELEAPPNVSQHFFYGYDVDAG